MATKGRGLYTLFKTMAAKGKGLEVTTVARVEEIKKKLEGARQLSHEWLRSGEWLKSGTVHYQGPDGKKRTWETVERTTRKGRVDATDVLMLTSGREKICLVAVYRPPVDRISLELPSGLVEANESLDEAALRELEEETGYKGVVKSVSPVLHIDPWKSNENGVVCTVSPLDGNSRESTLKLDENEFLETLELPLRDLTSQLETLQNEYGFVIDARLYYFALGLAISDKSHNTDD